MDKEELAYRVGGLLYFPAVRTGIAEKIAHREFLGLTSLAFDLEDAVADDAIKEAATTLRQTLATLKETASVELPLIFVRVRTPEHLAEMHEFLAAQSEIITGYVLPKFDLNNAADYLGLIGEINRSARRFYFMPTLETVAVADKRSRLPVLSELKEMLSEKREAILNVRVGANDFCQLYGLRRGIEQTIYDVGLVRDILLDILNVFAVDYVVSGPVWNYFGSPNDGSWQRGLIRELALDRLNGFIGKTAIHPSQLPLIYRSLAVSQTDYDDACAILGNEFGKLGVAKSAAGNRMNEVKCHNRWAERIRLLGKIYGIIPDENDCRLPDTAFAQLRKEINPWLGTAPTLASELPDAMVILNDLIY